jgi:hypothetical protein
MSTATNIAINLVTEYKGSQKLKAAEKDMNVLGQAAKELGKTFAKVFAVEKILEFSKNAVEAFAADEKSAKILSNTLSNLGIAFDNVPVETFITKLSELNGVAKTDLRNAFDTLVRSTGDAKKAQDLLALGLDVSAGTGKDLALVSTALAKGYAGNFAALSKLGAGITAAELKARDFTAVQKHLASVFKGDAATAADSFSGKMARLKTTFEEVKITIGSGLVDAFANLTKGGDLTKFQETMQSVALNVADIYRGLGLVYGEIGTIISKVNGVTGGLLGKLFSFSFSNSAVGQLLKLGRDSRNKNALQGAVGSTLGEYQNNAANNARVAAAKKQAADALAAQKAITDQKAKQLKLDQAALSLKLAGNTTDMQNIEIQAALQRGQTQQVTDVLLLQRAIITGNADQANILSQKVLAANDLVMGVDGTIGKLSTAKDPFKDWPPATSAALAQIKSIEDAVAAIKDKTVTITVNTVSTGSNGVTSKTPTTDGSLPPFEIPGGGVSTVGDYLASLTPFTVPGGGVSTVGDYLAKTNNNGLYANPGNGASTIGDYNAGVNVTVMLNGKTVADAITGAQVDNSASGIPSSFQRSGYGTGALPW